MTGVYHSGHKISPPNVRKINQRSQRPASCLKRTASKGKAQAGAHKAEDSSEGDMASTFLQFCATCEKQIEHPSGTVLYCSEACRRTDTIKPLSLSANVMASTDSSHSRPTTPSTKPRVILQPLTPTAVIAAPAPEKRIPPDLHNHKPDLDPTEWKPKPSDSRRPGTPSTETDAFRYLSQFHRHGPRPSYYRSATSLSNAILTTNNTPSLAPSPISTAASSVSSSVSYPSALELNSRPLLSPVNSDPFLAGATKSVDLVTPIAPQPMESLATSLPDHDLMGATWERKIVKPVDGETRDGLGKFLRGTERED